MTDDRRAIDVAKRRFSAVKAGAGERGDMAVAAVLLAVWLTAAAGLWLSVQRAAATSAEDGATTAVLSAGVYVLAGLGASGYFRRPKAPPLSFMGMLVLMVAPQGGRFFGTPWLGWSVGALGVVVAIVALARFQRAAIAEERA